MGIDVGFDIACEKLEKQAHLLAYDRFVQEIRVQYADDPLVWFGEKGFHVLQGEQPAMPYDGRFFRRFSSKVTGSHARQVERYIREIRVIFVKHMGENLVEWWSEYTDLYATRDWNWAREGINEWWENPHRKRDGS